MQCNINIQNTTGGLMSLSSSPLSWGKWNSSPVAQIKNGTQSSCQAMGAKGSATGTQGSVTYQLPDNQTSITINFDIPYSGSNGGGLSISGPGASTYSAQETDSGYVNVVSFPTSGDAPTVYFAIGLATSSTRQSDFDKVVRNRVKHLSPTPAAPGLDMAEVARGADCGEITGQQLVKFFNGKTSASALDILGPEEVPPGDRVRFVSDRGIISTEVSYHCAIDFAENVLSALKSDQVAYDLGLEAIEALRLKDPSTLTKIANALEEVKGVVLAQRTRAIYLPQLSAIDAILACIYMDPGAALLQSGSCARNTAPDELQYQKIAYWQLQHMQQLLS
jgi:hypothetical protein